MLRAIEWIVLGSFSTTAIIAGVRRHRPARIAPWLLLAASVASAAVGDVLNSLNDKGTADLCYLAMLALVALSLVQLTRAGGLLVDRARLIDLCAFTCSMLLVVWVFVVGGGGRFGSTSAAYVLGGLLLVGVTVRLIVAAGRNWSAALLAIGAFAALTSDVIYPLAPGPLTETGFVVMYLCWGAAALHPSMVRLTEPRPARPVAWDGRWATLLGMSVATPPLVLLIEAISGTVRDGVVIAVAAAITLMLTITRLADSLARHSQALTREKGLREASAALVAAADLAAVDEAVRRAIAELMPAHAVDQIIFATDDRQLTLAALPPAADAKRSDGAGSARADPGSTRADPGSTRADPGSERPDSGGRRADAGSRRPDGPSGDGGAQRSWWAQSGPEVGILVCPLWLEPLAVARPNGGALAIVGRRDYLAATRDTLEVLAGQAALALDRISLVEAVGRRDSDLYLRAVIRNTAEIMLVADEDQRIRYASPALRALLGIQDLPPLATLCDFVHRDDRSEVRHAMRSQGDGVFFCALQRPADDTQVLVEATYRDLREDRLVQGYVVTMRDLTDAHVPGERIPQLAHLDEMPAWVNRRSAQHKFRY